jgi:DHA1 family bicyclomycin/chloramphenicol resistance-like MFS transporter
MGAIQMSVGASASALVSVLQNHTALPMAGVMACCSMGAFALLNVGRRMISYRASVQVCEEEDVEMISTL